MAISHWMSWEGGVDLTAATLPGLAMPNVIVHVARMVHTPVGSAPSGMILYQPMPDSNPVVAGFVSEDPEVGKYFGPNIFGGTPFEKAPVLKAKIEIGGIGQGVMMARITIGNLDVELRLGGLKPPEMISREPGKMTPFMQQGLESEATMASLKMNGTVIELLFPTAGISGGPAAVVSQCGVYAR